MNYDLAIQQLEDDIKEVSSTIGEAAYPYRLQSLSLDLGAMTRVLHLLKVAREDHRLVEQAFDNCIL